MKLDGVNCANKQKNKKKQKIRGKKTKKQKPL
jgi:hypothetical protein